MKSMTLLTWALVLLAACLLAVVMVALIAVVAVMLSAVAVAAAPFELLIRIASLFSPRFDIWTSSVFDRFARRFTTKGSGTHTS